MQKLITWILVLALLFGCAAAAEDLPGMDGGAEEEYASLPEVLNVGSSTKLSGCFFTDLWKNNTSDGDVRAMIHGMSTVCWKDESKFELNPTVVKEQRVQDNADGSRTYYITLNEEMKYSDGSEITAADYVFSVLLLASPQLAQLGAAETAYTYIQGYEDYHTGKTECLKGVRLLGRYIFSVTVSAEHLPYFYEDAYCDVTPYPIRSLLGDFDVEETDKGARIVNLSVSTLVQNENGTVMEQQPEAFTAELLSAHLFGEGGYMSHPAVTSGPYILVRYDEESGTAEFVKNEFFIGDPDGNVPSIERVNFTWCPPEEAIEGLKSGRFHLINKCVSAEVIEEGLMAEDVSFATYARRGMGYICFACDSEFLADADLRKAICMAMDREGLINSYLGGYGMPIYGYYGMGQWMAQAANGAVVPTDLTQQEQEAWDAVSLEALNTAPYDPEAAIALLEGLGWSKNAVGAKYDGQIRYRWNERGGQKLSLTFAKSRESRGAEAVLEYLIPAMEQLGIELVVEEISFDELLNELYKPGERKYDMYFLGSNFNAVFDITAAFSTDAAYDNVANVAHIHDPELARLAKEMNRVEKGDVTGYFTAWFAFQQRFVELMPYMPIYSDVYMDFYTNVLQGYYINAYESWGRAVVPAYFGYPEQEEPLDEDMDPFSAEQEADMLPEDMFLD